MRSRLPSVFLGSALAMGTGLVTTTCARHYSGENGPAPPVLEAGDGDGSNAASTDAADAAGIDSGVADSSVSDASDDGEAGSCPYLAGNWDFTGVCGNEVGCAVTQNGCSFGTTCGPSVSLQGTAASTGLSMTGASAGMAVNCECGPFVYDAGKAAFPCQCVVGVNSCPYEVTQTN
jgi:hypothetical protein